MKQVIQTGPQLSVEERNLLSVAYKNKAAETFFDAVFFGHYFIPGVSHQLAENIRYAYDTLAISVTILFQHMIG